MTVAGHFTFYQEQHLHVCGAGGPCLADVAGPGGLLLARGGYQDHGEGLKVFGLHHDLEVQVLQVLAALVCLSCRRPRRHNIAHTHIHTHTHKYIIVKRLIPINLL